MIAMENNRAVLKDPETTDRKTWSVIAGQANLLGYAIGGPDDAKKIYSRFIKDKNDTYIFNEDLSERLAEKLFGIRPDKKQNDGTDRKYADAAESFFGTTENLRTAGYVTANGNFLPLTYDGIHRNRDHRDIYDAMKDTVPDCPSGTELLILFMNAGNIRLNSNGFDISAKITERQIPALSSFIDWILSDAAELYVVISTPAGGTAFVLHYGNAWRTKDIIVSINKTLETGLPPKEIVERIVW